MKYLVARYEDNGYHDSYFYAVLFDTDKNQIVEETEGATAYANGWTPVNYPKLNIAPIEVQEKFKIFCLNKSARIIEKLETMDIQEPNTIQNGEQIITIKEIKSRKQGTIPKGTIGKVFWHGNYGKFYRNGYNKPNRWNTRLGIVTESGDKYFINLDKCSLNKRIRSYEEIRKNLKARWENKSFNIQPLTGCKAWFSEIFIF